MDKDIKLILTAVAATGGLIAASYMLTHLCATPQASQALYYPSCQEVNPPVV